MPSPSSSAIAVGAACGLAGTAAYSFVLPTQSPVARLRGVSLSSVAPQEPRADMTAPQGMGCTSAMGIIAVAAAGLAARNRRAASARQASLFGEEAAENPTTFAGGLVGSEYAGWGTYQFDPANLSGKFPELLPWFREAELKHGRIAMLACVGAVVPEAVRLPFDAFSDPSLDFVTAHSKLIGPGLGEGPMWYLLIACSVVESLRFKTLGLGFEKLTLENAGDLDFGKSFMPKTEEGITQMKIKELKNGRLAMLAFSGAITQAVLWEQHNFPYA